MLIEMLTSTLLVLPVGSALVLVMFYIAMATFRSQCGKKKLAIAILAVMTSTMVNLAGFMFVQCIVSTVASMKAPLEDHTYGAVWQFICTGFFCVYVGHVLVLAALLFGSWWVSSNQVKNGSCPKCTSLSFQYVRVHAKMIQDSSNEYDWDVEDPIQYFSNTPVVPEISTNSSASTKMDISRSDHECQYCSFDINSALNDSTGQHSIVLVPNIFHKRNRPWFCTICFLLIVVSAITFDDSWWALNRVIFTETTNFCSNIFIFGLLLLIIIAACLLVAESFSKWINIVSIESCYLHLGITIMLLIMITGLYIASPWCDMATSYLLYTTINCTANFTCLLLFWQYLHQAVVRSLECPCTHTTESYI